MKTFCLKLYVAKCNLGKVNPKAMLVSSFPSHTRGGPMPLAGASRDYCTYAVACLQFFAKCYCNSLLLECQFVLWFFPIPPLEVWVRLVEGQ